MTTPTSICIILQAGRAILDRIHYLATQNEDFAFETILASRTFASWVNNLKSSGYVFHLEYLWLVDGYMRFEQDSKWLH